MPTVQGIPNPQQSDNHNTHHTMNHHRLDEGEHGLDAGISKNQLVHAENRKERDDQQANRNGWQGKMLIRPSGQMDKFTNPEIIGQPDAGNDKTYVGQSDDRLLGTTWQCQQTFLILFSSVKVGPVADK